MSGKVNSDFEAVVTNFFRKRNPGLVFGAGTPLEKNVEMTSLMHCSSAVLRWGCSALR